MGVMTRRFRTFPGQTFYTFKMFYMHKNLFKKMKERNEMKKKAQKMYLKCKHFCAVFPGVYIFLMRAL